MRLIFELIFGTLLDTAGEAIYREFGWLGCVIPLTIIAAVIGSLVWLIWF